MPTISNPVIVGGVYKAFSGRPLFGTAGPQLIDCKQGSLTDCWLISGLGAMAIATPTVLRNSITANGDSTFTIVLDSVSYNVDNKLPVKDRAATGPKYARFGEQRSMWVALAEKAFACHRVNQGMDRYDQLQGGRPMEIFAAFDLTVGRRNIVGYASAAAMATDLHDHMASSHALTVSILNKPVGLGLKKKHAYAITAAGDSSVVLRDPAGGKLVTVTPAQLYACSGTVDWGQPA